MYIIYTRILLKNNFNQTTHQEIIVELVVLNIENILLRVLRGICVKERAKLKLGKAMVWVHLTIPFFPNNSRP